MKKTSAVLNVSVIILVLAYIFILLARPDICRNGTVTGILLCGRVIIPSLFPFVMCVVFIMNSGLLGKLNFLFTSSEKFSAENIFTVLLSFIGGYPIGAKLLNSAVECGRISPKKAGNMLNYCVNAGPAFIVSAVGSGILGSKELGFILLISHIFSGLILCLISVITGNAGIKPTAAIKKPDLNAADNFVKSAAEASGTVLSICGFVILFSSVNAYISYYADSVYLLKGLGLVLEVTNAVTLTNNIYLISFLLGFAGISVWCQILSVSGKIKINYIKFVIFRLSHGLISAVITYIQFKIFPVNIAVFSNSKGISFNQFHSSAAVALSLFAMGVVFIISISSKKCTGKMLEDMI